MKVLSSCVYVSLWCFYCRQYQSGFDFSLLEASSGDRDIFLQIGTHKRLHAATDYLRLKHSIVTGKRRCIQSASSPI